MCSGKYARPCEVFESLLHFRAFQNLSGLRVRGLRFHEKGAGLLGHMWLQLVDDGLTRWTLDHSKCVKSRGLGRFGRLKNKSGPQSFAFL